MMTDDRSYLVYGVVLLLSLFLGDLRGWTLESADELKNVPKTVRDNPGVYRAHYTSHYHYIGGK